LNEIQERWLEERGAAIFNDYPKRSLAYDGVEGLPGGGGDEMTRLLTVVEIIALRRWIQ
jgi:hypothetical protein